MALPRKVSQEELDELAATDVRAIRARRDLRRVNHVMGTRGIIIRGMQPLTAGRARDLSIRMLELGAGDGRMMLGVAQKMSSLWPAVQLTLLDRLALIEADTSAALASLGWSVQVSTVDVLDWAAAPLQPSLPPRWDVIVTNLFLHHFDDLRLPVLLAAIAARCNLFVACEPRRALVSLIGSHLIGALGTSRVTREDAVLSVHAGFRDAELSAVWPGSHDEWHLQENSAAFFSHFFRAARRSVATADA